MTTHLMDAWRDAFVVELRLREVPGAAIGDALAQVDAHCAESGESPQQAFGDPDRYAAALADALPRVAPERTVSWWWATRLALGTGLGTTVLVDGTAGLGDGTGSATVSVGSVVAAVLGAVAAGLVTANLRLLVRPSPRYRGVALVGAAALAVVVPPLLWRQALTTVSPAWAVLLIGVGVLALTWLPAWRALRTASRQDRIVDPRTGAQPFRTPWWVTVLTIGFPAVMLATVVLLVLLG